MSRFAFVILHYIAIEDTKRCVYSILENCKENDVNIVIVDNASPDNSGKELEKIFKENENIKIIINKENLGFSAGNNVGFKYVKKYIKSDFIILCNNDTYLLDDKFYEEIEKEYRKSSFTVLGPQILLPENKIQRIPSKNIRSIYSLRKEEVALKREIFFYNVHLEKIYNILRKIKKTMISEKEDILDVNARYENVVLHGCFWIFSQEYINKYDGLNAKTFLYREEELLYHRVIKSNGKMVYNPQIKIFHNKEAATNLMNKTERRRQMFFLKNYLVATEKLLEELENE